VAAHLFHTPRYFEYCQIILLPLLNDPAREIRDEVRDLFRQESNMLNNTDLKPFILKFIGSQTFADDPTVFIWSIKENYTGSILFMKDVLFSLCETIIRKMPEQSRERSTGLAHDVSELVSVILRLYEQSIPGSQAETTNRCLDIWDAFFQNRIGIVHELAKAIEQ